MALGQLVAHSLTGMMCWISLSELHLREAPPVCRNTSLPALSFSKRLLKKNPEHKCSNPRHPLPTSPSKLLCPSQPVERPSLHLSLQKLNNFLRQRRGV